MTNPNSIGGNRNVDEAQKEMRHAYYGGGPGVLISGLIWLITGILSYFLTAQMTILIFFFGGMLIHPLGLVASKLLMRSGKHDKHNPFGKLAMESTILLFVGLFIAYSVFQLNPNWFFPIMLMIIGARYLVFQTIYGLKLFWVLGMILIVAGFVSMRLDLPFQIPAVLGGVIEIVIGTVTMMSEKRNGY